MSALAQRLVDHAALSGPFEPERFLYDHEFDSPEVSQALKQLVPLCQEIVVESKIFWLLRPGDRTRALRSLVDRQTAMRRLWRKRPPLRIDAFARTLRACLEGSADQIKTLELELLSDKLADDALRAAISATVFAAPLVEDERRALVEEFERALYRLSISRAEDARRQAVLPFPLCGRTAERDSVLRFVRGEGIEPPLRRLVGPQPDDRARTLLLTGSPGIGKSAFLADLTEKLRSDDAWLLTFDFDQTTLARGGMMAWTEEMTRQIGRQEPDLEADLASLRARYAGERRLGGRSLGTRLAQSLHFDAEDIIAKAEPRRLIVVLDTIEELVALNPRDVFAENPTATVLYELLEWLDRLTFSAVGERRTLSVVASGRTQPPVDDATLEQWFDARLGLPELAEAEAVLLLSYLRDPLRKTERERVARAVGGHPLHLILVHKHLVGLDREERTAEVQELAQEGLRSLSPNAVMQSLYARFLKRLRLPALPAGLSEQDIRELAHPGLVLRHIDEDLLADVVAPAVDVHLSTPEKVSAAFQALREQVWLVTPDAHGIRHRPDVRRVMLPMMLSEQKPETRRVLAFAVEHYDGRTGPDAQAEAAYLRALRGDVDWFIDRPDAANTASAQLGEEIDIVDISVRAVLKFHDPDGGRLDADELRALPSDLSARAGVRQEEELFASTGRRGGGQWKGKASPIGFAPSTLPVSSDLAILLDDEELQGAIQIAFQEARFEDVVETGWDALAAVEKWPSLRQPLPIRTPFHEHWLWQVTLATALVAPPLPWQEVRLFGAKDLFQSGNEKRPSPYAARHEIALLRAMAGASDSIDDAFAYERERLPVTRTLRELRMRLASPLLRPTLPDRTQLVWLNPATLQLLTSEARLLVRDLLLHLPGASPEREPKAKMDLPMQPTTGQTAPVIALALSDLKERVSDRLPNALRVLDSADPNEDRNEGSIELPFPEVGEEERGVYLRFFRGQTPELHRTIATALTQSPSDAVEAGFRTVVDAFPDWSGELEMAFGFQNIHQSARSGLEDAIGLVRFADLAGLLPAFLQAAAQTNASDVSQRCIALLDALDERWSVPRIDVDGPIS